MDVKLETKIAPESESLFRSLICRPGVSILCGPNNSGKSFILKELVGPIRNHQNGIYPYPIGISRLQSLSSLPHARTTESELHKRYEAASKVGNAPRANTDVQEVAISESIASLGDLARSKLFALLDRILGTKTEMALWIPENRASAPYLEVDGYSAAYTSSGFRYITALFTSLMYEHSTFLIDEPELGVSPRNQAIISELLYDDREREKVFPHIKSIVLATHSPVFLDRRTPANNFFVTRAGNEIKIEQLASVQEISRLQFYLLGDRFETLFLPSVIILVEGDSDYDYIYNICARRFPKSPISVIDCGNDNGIGKVVRLTKKMFGDIQKSPYSNRIFCVFDKAHEKKLPDHCIEQGIHRDNVIVLRKNGIEHYYPRDILEAKYGKFDEIEFAGSDVMMGASRVPKTELARYVSSQLTSDSKYPEELETRLLTPVGRLLAQ